jgi:hypothetical protein
LCFNDQSSRRWRIEHRASAWTLLTPKATDTITWTTGENKTDGQTHMKLSLTEQKFDTSSTPPSGVTPLGFDSTDTGPYGSKALTSGLGSSAGPTPLPITIGSVFVGTTPIWNASWLLPLADK